MPEQTPETSSNRDPVAAMIRAVQEKMEAHREVIRRCRHLSITIRQTESGRFDVDLKPTL